MRFMTLNTWQERGPWQERWKIILDRVKHLKPDLIAFQEVFNNDWARHVQEELDFKNLACFEESSGLVLLTSYEMTESEILTYETKAPSENFRRYVVYGRFKVDETELAVFNTHLSWRPEESDIRQKQVNELLSYINQKAKQIPTLVSGDFNATSDSAEISMMIEEGKFLDCYGSFHPQDLGLTWSHKNPYTHSEYNRWNDGLLPERRIDYVFVRPYGGILSHLNFIEVQFDQPDEKGLWASDHFGLLADFTKEQAS